MKHNREEDWTDAVRRSLEGAESPLPEGGWERLERRLADAAPVASRTSSRRIYWRFAAAAAAVLVCVSIGIGVFRSDKNVLKRVVILSSAAVSEQNTGGETFGVSAPDDRMAFLQESAAKQTPRGEVVSVSSPKQEAAAGGANPVEMGTPQPKKQTPAAVSHAGSSASRNAASASLVGSSASRNAASVASSAVAASSGAMVGPPPGDHTFATAQSTASETRNGGGSSAGVFASATGADVLASAGHPSAVGTDVIASAGHPSAVGTDVIASAASAVGADVLASAVPSAVGPEQHGSSAEVSGSRASEPTRTNAEASGVRRSTEPAATYNTADYDGLFASAEPERRGGSVGFSAGGIVTTASGVGLMGSSPSIISGDAVSLLDAYDEYSYDHKQPLSFGLTFRKNLGRGFSLESGLIYTLLRSTVTIPGVTNDVRQQLHLLGIPLRVNWTFLQRGGFSLYLGAGGQADMCVSARFGREIVSEKKVLWSVSGVLGAQYRLGNMVGIYFEPGVSHYLTNTTLRTSYTDSSVNLNLQLGVRFNY